MPPGIAIGGTTNQLIRSGDQLSFLVLSEDCCLAGDIDLGRKGVVRLDEVGNCPSCRQGVPVIVGVIHLMTRGWIGQEEIIILHIRFEIAVEISHLVDKTITLVTSEKLPILMTMSFHEILLGTGLFIPLGPHT